MKAIELEVNGKVATIAHLGPSVKKNETAH